MDDDDPMEVVREHYHDLDGYPVSVCVLVTRGGLYFAGASATSVERYRADTAHGYAKQAASRSLLRYREKIAR